MATAKTKSIETLNQFNTAVDEIALLQVCIIEIEVKRDKEIHAVKDKYKGDLEALETKRDLKLKLAEEFADENREEVIPKGMKSGETAQGVYGFRQSSKLAALRGKWNEEKILEAIKSEHGARFVRIEETVDKEKLREELNDTELAAVGLRVSQSDKFFVDPKAESGDRVVASKN